MRAEIFAFTLAVFGTTMLPPSEAVSAPSKPETRDFLCLNLFEASAEPSLAAFAEGLIYIPKRYGISNVPIDGGVDWASFNGLNPTTVWWLNTLAFTTPLMRSNDAPHEHLDLAIDLVMDWAASNAEENTAVSERAWDGHAVALRSERLACLSARRPDDERLHELVELHGSYLASAANYQGSWNHGLDQNIALASLACKTRRADWARLARERTIDALEVMVDWQGVSNEQATHYQLYTYQRITHAFQVFEQCDSPLPPEPKRRIQLMPDVYGHAIKPDGGLVELGDTYVQKATIIPGTLSEFVVTQGERGPRPESRFAVFPNGYVFGRSGWGDEGSFDQESFYSLRFGPSRIIHGHNDHTSVTYYSRGRDLLTEGGFHGYGDSDLRSYLRTPQAHNVVYSIGNERFRWDATTSVSNVDIRRNWQSYTMRDAPYPGTQRRRDVLFVREPIEAIVVVDSLQSTVEMGFEQSWHFAPEMAVEPMGEGQVRATVGELFVDLFQMWPHDDLRIAAGESNPFRGWYSAGLDDVVAAPTVLTQRRGTDVTYLTVFVIHQEYKAPTVSQKRVSGSNVTRMVEISLGKKAVRVALNHNGTLSIE